MWDGQERRSSRTMCKEHSGLQADIMSIKTLLKLYIGISATGTIALIGWLLLMQRDIAQIYQRLPRLLSWLGF